MFGALLLSVFISVSLASIPKPDGRIFGGDETTIDKFPFQVSLPSLFGEPCSGVLLKTRWFLTAAHCVSGTNLVSMVSAGSTSRTGIDAVFRPILRTKPHESYNSQTGDYNIALVQLLFPFTLSNKIQLVKLPASNLELSVGTLVKVTGWGATENGTSAANLRVVQVPIVGQQECNETYSGIITDRMFCAGEEEGGKDSCTGDTGGPVTIDGVLVGIVSKRTECAKPNTPGVYTNIINLLSWINQNAT